MRQAHEALQEMLPVPIQAPASPMKETTPFEDGEATLSRYAFPAAIVSPSMVSKTLSVAQRTSETKSL
jgi:hypothetical protein